MYLPRVDDLVENFSGAYVKKMHLEEHFTLLKAETAELQKFLVNLGFNQPIIFEMCRMKVNLLTCTLSKIELKEFIRM